MNDGGCMADFSLKKTANQQDISLLRKKLTKHIGDEHYFLVPSPSVYNMNHKCRGKEVKCCYSYIKCS
jgi:hypothetical protein